MDLKCFSAEIHGKVVFRVKFMVRLFLSAEFPKYAQFLTNPYYLATFIIK